MTQQAIVYRIAAAAAALVLLAACGDDGDDTTASGSSSTADKPLSTPATTPEASDAPSTGKKAAIEVDESEFMIKMPTTLAAGTYTFTVLNNGTLAHSLQVDGPGVEDETSGTIQAGAEGSLTVNLQKGTYHFYCSVGDHESKGMELDVTVT
jgi:uncharacterized cupredoxin-like copper-binding protein